MKLKTKMKRIKNMVTGERFFLGNHSSLMIKTDYKTQSLTKGIFFLAVSENGFTEWVKDDLNTYMCVTNAKTAFNSLSGSIKNNVINIDF